MGFDGRPADDAASPVKEWMSSLHPTRNSPTALRYRDMTVIYWRENEAWVAREFGRPPLLVISEDLRKVIEADQEYARKKLLE